MTRAFLSIGSNQQRRAHVRAALLALEARYGPLLVSPVYECPAVGFEGADFFNLAVAFDTEVPPAQLVAELKALERRLGRRRRAEKFSDRTIDIDLVMYGSLCEPVGGLRLPRRDVLRRAFILRPLADIAPDVVHPETGRTLAESWRDLAAVNDGGLRPVEL